MPTLRPPHHHRDMAESFGVDPERYDRARPRYPDALVAAVVAAAPGPDVLDVGCGTGIVARQFRAAGCRVLGVDVDERMAEYARRDGTVVEVGAFEDWDPAGRTYDAVVAGQTWHWVDPVAGAARAARVLRPRGLLAVFWNVFRPAPELAAALSAVHRRVVPDGMLDPWAQPARDGYGPFVDGTVGGMRSSGAFAEPQQWRFDWERTSTRDEWLEQMRTSGVAGRLPSGVVDELLAGTGAVVDELGGSITMSYTALAVVAVRAA